MNNDSLERLGRGLAALGAGVNSTLVQRAALVLAILCGLVVPALAQQSGRASALGSDVLALNGGVFQLFGIDGMDFNQSCFVDGQPLACGASATRALQILLDPAAVSCAPTGGGNGSATYAKCSGTEGDIAEALVKQGWALADRNQSTDYVAAEDEARAAKAGVWRGTFLAPWDYRTEIAAIEASYAKRAAEAAADDAGAAITGGAIGLNALERVQIRTIPVEGGTQIADQDNHEIHVADFKPGFINAAITPPDIFEWKVVADMLETTRRAAVTTVRDSVVQTVWDGLKARPSQKVISTDSRTFYEALRANSAPWLSASRQPVLFIAAQDVPNWVHEWFSGNAPTGAQISSKEGLDGNYVGTIDGIDIYVGPSQREASLLFPSDILAEMSYRTRDDGKLVSVSINPGEGNEWVLQFALTLRWRNDVVTWIEYPPTAAVNLDAS